MGETNENAQTPESSENTEQAEEAPQAQPSEDVSKDARMWAMLCHLGGLAGFIFPFGNIILPLVLWQIKKDESSFIDEQGKEAVNFQISMTLYLLVGVALCFITCVGAVLIPFIAIAIGMFDLIFLLIAAVKANNGQSYQYPLIIRLIK